MATVKEIRRRIKSATSTKQIIKAMELVSVVKMQKAVAANLAARPYATTADGMIKEICAQMSDQEHPFFTPGRGDKKLVVVISTDRGLCGSLNIKIINKLLADFDKKKVDIVVVGKRGRDILRILDLNIIAEFIELTDHLEFKDVYPILKLIEGEFLTDKYESIQVVYPRFESTLSQIATTVKLLPFETKTEHRAQDSIIYEPNKQTIRENLVPRILEIILWQILLETMASEHSARMVSMKNANENAEELIDDLTLVYNQTRQAGITSELAEISAGKMTLEGQF